MRTWSVLGLLATGCTVSIGNEPDDGPASLAFSSPAPGASFTRNTLADNGALVAAVPLVLDVSGNVAQVKVTSGTRDLGDATSGELTAELLAAGAKTITATAVDDSGATVATATLDIMVAEPNAASCHDWLDLYKLDYTVGPANQGVADPITVKTPINGVKYRYNGSTTPRTTLYGDCALIKSLAQAAPFMRDRDVATLVDIGVYNYRCINQSLTPPNCTMSQHAYAKAIDIAGFEAMDGTKYSVLTDWVIDSGETCSSATEPGKDTFLHEIICAIKAADVWNIVLTPNYNTAHRNHFHVDLTAGSDTIKRLAPEQLLDYRAFSSLHAD